MKAPRKFAVLHNLITRNSSVLPTLVALGLVLMIITLALVMQRRFAATAQEPSEGRASEIDLPEIDLQNIHLIEIAPDPNGATGIAHHQPSNSLLLLSSEGMELFGPNGARAQLSRIGVHNSRILAVRESRHGFTAGEVFAGTDTLGAIVRLSPADLPLGALDGALDVSRASGTQIFWTVLEGETGLVSGLYLDRQNSSANSSDSSGAGFDSDLIAVTTGGGVWRIDSTGNARRVTALITARSDGAVESPVSFDAVTLAPNDPLTYGALAGKILAVAGRQGLMYVIDAGGRVESFDLGVRHLNNLLVIPANENFFGVTIDRQTADQPKNQTRNQGMIWGAPAADFAGAVGDFLITQTGGESCQCQPAIWRMRWNGAEFEKMKLAEISNMSHRVELGQVTFSPFGGELFNDIHQPGQPGQTGQQPDLRLVKSVADLNGGFIQPGDTLEYTLALSNPSNRAVGASFIAEFIPGNTDYVASSTRIIAGANAGAKTDAIDDDQVDAIKAGDRVVQINIGAGAGAGGHDSGGLRGGILAPSESATVVFRVTVKTGLSEGAPIINGAQWGAENIYPAGNSNIVATTVGSPLKLEKSVTDLNGGQTLPGDTLEYKLALTNQSFNPVNNSFIAEFIPKGVTYVANSVQITAGANTGAKTDAIDTDQVDYYPSVGANGQINIATGAGAGGHTTGGGLIGGTLAPGESATAVFRVRVNTGAGVEAIVANGANAGANDIYPIANSNVVTTTVSAATPLIGPFGEPAATGPTNNNDDFTLGRVNLTVSNGVTTETGAARFINTVKNVGAIPGKFVISAPAIPAGFSVRASVDSGATFVSLNQGVTATTPTDVNPNEERNIDVRVELPVGLAVNTNYDIVIQAAWDVDPSRVNRTIDRVRPDQNPPNLTLTKAARNLSGQDITGGTVTQGQTIEYRLTLSNPSSVAVGNTFIAEYLPPNVTYVAESTQITAGPNAGPKTDARGDDQVDFFPSGFVNGQLNIFTGAGATAVKGGALAPGESATVVFRVRVDDTVANGTAIRNGANWGGEDFVIGGSSNIVTVTVSSSCAPPTITVQPTSGAVCAGGEKTFRVTATGTSLSYQWRKDGVNIPGATTNGITLTKITAMDAGSYDVVITNACGTVTSNAATLTVDTPIAITAQPASLVRAAGQGATFSVTGAGGGLTYQWRKNGVNIPGATGSSFTIAPVTPGDAGSYDVVITNACGSVTSSAATLTVSNCQPITISPVALPVGVFGTAYSQTITQTGGDAPISFSLSAGAPPAGITLNATTGVLSGTPTQVGQFSFTITATDTNGCTGVQPYLLPITPSATPDCRQTICFRSAAYFSLNFGTSAIPNGMVLIGGVNLNNPIASTDQRVKQALDGQFGALNREFVAAQLNILNASGLGAADVITALASQLSCYGLQFAPVTLSNGAPLNPQSSLSDLIAAANFLAKGGGNGQDNCIVTRLLGALNGTSAANVCTRPLSPVDLSGCL